MTGDSPQDETPIDDSARELDWGERDAEQNIATAPRPGQSVRCQGMVLAEIYGPRSAGKLLAAFRKFGWDQPTATSDSSPMEWLREGRAATIGGRWHGTSLVPLTRTTGPTGMFARSVPLPGFVPTGMLRLTTITPAVTALVVAFDFNESSQQDLQRLTSADRTTEPRPSSGRNSWISYPGPEHLKREAVEQWRADIRDQLTGWFRTHCPGDLCAQSPDEPLPTIEYDTVEGVEPLATDVRSEWLRTLSLHNAGGTWEHLSSANVRLSTGGYRRPKHHWLLAGRSHPEPGSRDSLRAIAGDVMPGIATALALDAMLASTAKLRATIRDQSTVSDGKDPAAEVEAVRTSEQRMAEVETYTTATRRYAHRLPQEPWGRFVSVLRLEHDEDPLPELDLQDQWAEGLVEVADAIDDDFRRIRVERQTNASLLAAATNLRLNERMVTLTKIAVAASLLAALAAMASLVVAAT